MPVLDLKQKVDKKTGKKTGRVHGSLKEDTYQHQHQRKIKSSPLCEKGIIKGFADRAGALCDDKHVADEPKNVEDVFVANGFERKIVQRYMEESKREEKEDQTEEQGYRGYRN